MDLAESNKVLDDLIKRHALLGEAELNEADTRIQFIDTILSQVLGWSRDQFHAEEYASPLSADVAKGKGKRKEWLDYHLQVGDHMRVVVEAKRIGKTFYLSRTKPQRVVRLRGLSENHGGPLAAVIRQASDYCYAVGTYAFFVTNGFQWIASVAFAHNVPNHHLNAVVFDGLEDIRKNLQEFIDVFSPGGLTDQILLGRAIGEHTASPPFARSLNEVHRTGTPNNYNYLSSQIHLLMRLCFGDLTDAEHTEMLESCYVGNEVTDDYMKRLEVFVGTALPYELHDIRTTKIDRNQDGGPFVEAAKRPGESILVIGKAGSGKSTFLGVTRRTIEKKLGTNRWVLLHVDLINRTQLGASNFDHDRLVNDVCKEVLLQAESKYVEYNPFDNNHLRDIFSGEIRRLRSSMSPSSRNTGAAEDRIEKLIQDHLARPDTHLKAYLGNLTSKGIPVTVFLDNVDRGTLEFERVAFQLAQTLSANTGATIVTALRDTTFNVGKVGGFLDVGRHTVFSISPPSFSAVVAKRFDYARNRLAKDSQLSVRFLRQLAGTSPERVYDFIEIMAEFILGGQREIQDCIQAIAGTNVRRGLELLEDFATSPHTDLDRLYSQYKTRNFRQALDMFLKSIMRLSSQRYVEDGSKIANVWQASKHNLMSHFLSWRVLQCLAWQAAQQSTDPDMTVRELSDTLGALGHNVKRVHEVVNHLGRYGLLLSRSKPEPPWLPADTVQLSAAGMFYLRELGIRRVYIEHVVDDTILYDANVFDSIAHEHSDKSKSWPDKHTAKAKLFLSYLMKREKAELGTPTQSVGGHAWVTPIASTAATKCYGAGFVEETTRSSRKVR